MRPEPRSERERQRRIEREKFAPSQRGMGDLAAEFRDVTAGMEGMIDNVPDRLLPPDTEREQLDRIDDRAANRATEATDELISTANEFDVEADSKTDPGGLDLDLDVPEPGENI